MFVETGSESTVRARGAAAEGGSGCPQERCSRSKRKHRTRKGESTLGSDAQDLARDEQLDAVAEGALRRNAAEVQMFGRLGPGNSLENVKVDCLSHSSIACIVWM